MTRDLKHVEWPQVQHAAQELFDYTPTQLIALIKNKSNTVRGYRDGRPYRINKASMTDYCEWLAGERKPMSFDEHLRLATERVEADRDLRHGAGAA